MPSIDLNCDLGESFGAYTIGMDAEILPYITSANIACGFHAGDPSVMQKSVLLCKKYGVKVGAHPGLPDLQGFGRRKMAILPAEAEADVMYQIGALKAFCEAAGVPLQARNAVRELHARWAAEEADLRRSQPEFRLQEELKNPEMRRLMQLPGMRMRDAYRLVHYDESLHRAAQAVEQGVVQRIQQRAARPAENGIRPGGAATVHPDVASMTRAQREALERRVLHGAQIEL